MATADEKKVFKNFYDFVHGTYSIAELDKIFGYHDLESYKAKVLDDRESYEFFMRYYLDHEYDMPPRQPELFVMHELIPRIERDGGSDLEQAIYNSYKARKWWEMYDSEYRKMPPPVKAWYRNCLTNYFEVMFTFFGDID